MSLDGGVAELVYLRTSWREKRVIDSLALPLPSPSGEDDFCQEIQKFLLKNGVRSSDPVTLGLPRGEILLRHIVTPAIQEKDLPDLVAFESQRHLPGKREEFVVGHQVLGRTAEGGYALLLGAVGRAVLEKHLSLLRKANIAPLSLQPSTVGLVESFLATVPDSPPVLLLTLSAGRFSADYVEDGRLVESGHFRFGGDADGAAAVLSRPLFLRSLPGGAIPRLVIHGPLAGEDLADRLEALLRVPTALFTPLAALGGAAEGSLRARFGAALGLAILGTGAEGAGLELSQERAAGRKEKPRYRATATLAVALALLLAANFGVRVTRQHGMLKEIEARLSVLQEERKVLEGLDAAVRDRRGRVAYLTSTIHGRPRQTDILRELTVLMPEDSYLSDYTYNGEGKIEITGLSPSASKLIPILESSPLFREVAFPASTAIVSQGKDLERFKIRLVLEGRDDG